LMSRLRANPSTSTILCGCSSCVSHRLMELTWRHIISSQQGTAL
jgi:hypothetical protein